MDCPHIPEIGYGDFARRVSTWVRGRERHPIMGSFELTNRCNLRCVHCYLGERRTAQMSQREELTLPQIRNLFDQVANEGCLWFQLTGGEPMLRSDFLDIYRYAKQKGFLIALFTNGTLLTPRIADVLAEYRPFNTEITLYGYTQETYERITGVPGSHARCMRAIELLLERGVRLRLKTMLMTLNQHELGAMEDYAASLGVDFRFDPMINADLNHCRRPIAYRLTPEEIVEIDLAHPERVAEWKEFWEKQTNRTKGWLHPYVYTCGAGINLFHIDPYGQLHLCLLSREPGYDLLEGSFHDGWEHAVPQARRRVPSEDYACNECELLCICGQCPGWATLEQGDVSRAVPFLCEVARRRAKAFDLGGKAAVSMPTSSVSIG